MSIASRMSNAKVCKIKSKLFSLMCLEFLDTLRRMFMRWLTAARKSKTRRTLLAEREDELRLDILAAAWEAWRDRFRENRLRDLASYPLIIIWSVSSSVTGIPCYYPKSAQSSLQSICYMAVTKQGKFICSIRIILLINKQYVPGIRLYATNLKTKAWDLWRAAMPLAIQARKAREIHAKRVLCMFKAFPSENDVTSWISDDVR